MLDSGNNNNNNNKYSPQEMAMYERVKAELAAQDKRLKAEARKRQKASSTSIGSLASLGKRKQQAPKRKQPASTKVSAIAIF